MPPSLIIKNGRFTARLHGVSSLLVLPMANIRKLWKLMFDEGWSNAAAITAIEDWLPKELLKGADNLRRLEIDFIIAKEDAETKRRAVTVLGSSLDTKIDQAKRQLKRAKGSSAIQEARVNLYKAALPKTSYLQAIKAVKDIGSKVKIAKRNQNRLEKLQTVFDEMIQKANL